MKFSIQQNEDEVFKLLRTIERKGMDRLVAYLQSSDFFTAPCSSMYHLSEKGGLVQHSLNVYKYFKQILSLVNSKLPDESIILCALLHDSCKINLYKSNPNERARFFRAFVVDEKLPLGHGEKSVMIIQRFIELTDAEMLIIRWHMSAFDLSNYSIKSYYSAVEKCAEIVALQSADYLATTFLEAK